MKTYPSIFTATMYNFTSPGTLSSGNVDLVPEKQHSLVSRVLVYVSWFVGIWDAGTSPGASDVVGDFESCGYDGLIGVEFVRTGSVRYSSRCGWVR